MGSENDFNLTEDSSKLGHNIPALFDRVHGRYSQKAAIVCGEHTIAYSTLAADSDRLACLLLSRGISRGHTVAIAVDRTADMVMLMLGVLKAGAAYIPVNPALPSARVNQMLDDEALRMVIIDEKAGSGEYKCGDKAVCYTASELRNRIKDKANEKPEVDIQADDIAYIIYTSGSTGKPKGVEIHHGALCNYALSMQQRPGCTDQDRVMFKSTISFDMAVYEIYVPLLCGATIVQAQTHETVDARAMLDLMEQQGITLFFATPTTWQMLLDIGWRGTPGFVKLLTGGEALSPRMAERLTACAEEVWNIYGPTEATVSVTAWRVKVGEDILIGTPNANTRLYLLDKDLQSVPVGSTGDLYISGAGVARGYRNNPELTKTAFLKDPFCENSMMYKTGDLARFLDHKKLKVLGRADSQIKIRGQRLEPGDIEESITAHEGIANAIVVSRDERLVAYCVRQPGSASAEIPLGNLLRPWLEARLPAYMVPSFFVPIDRLPSTSNGKVDVKALPDPLSSITPAQIPASVLEQQLLAIWIDVLGHDQIGVEDNFFHVGGDSARVIQVQAKLEKLLSRPVRAPKLYEHFTITALAAYLSGTGDEPLAKEVSEEKEEGSAGDTIREDIAVISMACRLPGEIYTPEDFWKVLIEARDVITEVPKDRWDADAIYDADHEARGKSYSTGGGFVQSATSFDAPFFGISPREARAVDPTQSMILETCWEGFERAGYGTKALRGSQTGVFIGSGNSSLDDGQLSAAGREKLEGYLGLGTAPSVISGRVSYALGLEGPTMTVDAGCAASLVATHLACSALRQGECDMAVAGGVTFLPSPGLHVEFSRIRVASPDGRSRPFSADAAGMGLAEGASAVVLKRLSDAQRDGDEIHVVIRGSAVNHGGRGSTLSAPSGPGQKRLVRAALAAARLKPHDIDYVEAHGTGTKQGDPIEGTALAEVFGSSRDDISGPLWIGSSKSNIGHTQAAAGVAGLIKVALAMRHNMLPQTLHATKLNPMIDWEGANMRLSQSKKAWLPRENDPTIPRRAGVNSFGISGTNAHLIVEEPPKRDISRAKNFDDARSSSPLPFLISAYTNAALREQAKKLLNHLSSDAAVNTQLPDVAYSLATTRTHFPQRIVLTAQDKADLLGKLASIVDNEVNASSDSGKTTRIAMLFSGQGTQWVNMGKCLSEHHRVFRETVEQIAHLFKSALDKPLLEVVWADPASEAASLLQRTDYAQPALFALQVALWRLWQSWGVQPEVVLGHSIGEIAAAYVAGVMDLADACRLVATRGKLMHVLPENGGMVALESGVSDVIAAIEQLSVGDRVSIAAINTPRQVVASGDMDAIHKLVSHFTSRGRQSKVLKTSRAFHSHHLDESMLASLRTVAESIVFKEQSLPIVSTVTGRLAEPGQLSNADYWVQQACNPVLFAEGMKTLANQGMNCFVELGPGSTLCGMGASCLDEDSQANKKTGRRGVDLAWLPSLNSKSEGTVTIQNSLSELHIRRKEVDWTAYFENFGGRRVQLPTYAFQRQRYWLDGMQPLYSVQASIDSVGASDESVGASDDSFGGSDNTDDTSFDSVGVSAGPDEAKPNSQIQIGWHAIDTGIYPPYSTWGLLCPAGDVPSIALVKQALLHSSRQPIVVNQLEKAVNMAGVLCFWESQSQDELTAKASEQLQRAARICFSPLLVWVTRGVIGPQSVGGGFGEGSLWSIMRRARINYPQLRLCIIDLEDDVDIATATTLCSILMMSNEPECVIRGGRVLVPWMQMQSQALHESISIIPKSQRHPQQYELRLKNQESDEAVTPNHNGTDMVLDNFVNEMRKAGPDERVMMLERLVRDVTAEALGMTTAEEVDMHRGLVDIGVDSLGSMRMVKQLAVRTGVTLPVTFKEAYADLTSLSEALRQQIEDSWAAESSSRPISV